MTPEDKIVEAIDRNTEAVERQTKWLQVDEEDPSIVLLKDIRSGLKYGLAIIIGILVGIVLIALTAVAAPILPPLAQPPLFDIGNPPKPPPNPHVQYWHTMDVPGVNGVLPVEVFAPRLYSPVASKGPVDVDMPEPGTWVFVLSGTILLFRRLR